MGEDCEGKVAHKVVPSALQMAVWMALKGEDWLIAHGVDISPVV